MQEFLVPLANTSFALAFSGLDFLSIRNGIKELTNVNKKEYGLIFMVVPCIDDLKFFISPIYAHKLY
jgi:hypothetical protein